MRCPLAAQGARRGLQVGAAASLVTAVICAAGAVQASLAVVAVEVTHLRGTTRSISRVGKDPCELDVL
jgi:hypothetical protein